MTERTRLTRADAIVLMQSDAEDALRHWRAAVTQGFTVAAISYQARHEWCADIAYRLQADQAERERALALVAAGLDPANQNVRDGDLLAAIRDLRQISEFALENSDE